MESQDSFDDDEIESESGKTATQRRSTKPKRKPSAKIADHWEGEHITEMISHVEQYPCIWDFGHPEYKLRDKRSAAWIQISNAMGNRYTAEQCTVRWQYLRRTFRNRMQLQKQTKSGQAAVCKPNWPFYESMAFVAASERAQTTNTESNLDVIIYDN